MKILSRWLDRDGEEWWQIEGVGWRLAGRSPGGAMDGWERKEVEKRFGPLRPLDGREAS